ncbi:CAP domain-containing protein [Chloroflexales bacterium ZM16-3]|nr:CAP domain-containing protein [Chloroflexales bacterium ZM16-3]
MRYTPLFIAALILFSLSTRPAARAEPTLGEASTVYLPFVSVPAPNIQTPEQYAMAQAVVALVNSERVAVGCAPLTVNDKLVVAAQGQSQDMALNDFFSHTNPDPSRDTVGKRVIAAGYSSSFVGENIAAGYGTPAAVMAGWMRSPDHKKNMLNCAYTETGVGYYYQADDQPLPGDSLAFYRYWTQDFGRP